MYTQKEQELDLNNSENDNVKNYGPVVLYAVMAIVVGFIFYSQFIRPTKETRGERIERITRDVLDSRK